MLDPSHEAILPTAVAERLRRFRGAEPGARMVFLRRSFRPAESPSFFLARPSESRPDLRGWHLERYEDLLDLDLAAAAEGEGGTALEGPLLLVCTHGHHDRCCARWGHRFYRRLADRAGDAAWQSSHIGGDRFAANLLWLPWGIFYGRMEPVDAERLVEACHRGEVLLDRYRGRSCHPFHVQAAEYFLRRAADELRPDGVRWLGVDAEGEGRWSVRLARRGGRAVTVRVGRRLSDFRFRPTCHATSERPVPLYDLHGIEEAG